MSSKNPNQLGCGDGLRPLEKMRNRMRKFGILPVGLAVLALAGCVDTPEEQRAMNTATGALIGAGLGMAVSGDDDKLEGALIGGGVGALLGNAMSSGNTIGSQQAAADTTASRSYSGDQQFTDERTRAVVSAHNNAMEEALELGAPQRWRSFGVSGTIYPTSRWEEYGSLCRAYDSVWSDSTTGERGNYSGQACRQPNGRWRIL